MTAMRQDASTGQMVDDGKPAQAKGGLLDGKPVMDIKVYAPFKVYYEGQAFSVTAKNETGPFDILPRHRNFLCMLIPCDLVIETPHGTQTIKIARALMHVKAERVTIFVDV